MISMVQSPWPRSEALSLSPAYSHLTAEERDRLAGLMADGLSLRSIAKALGRAVSTISRELRRNALDSGAYRPHVADGAYMLRRQRAAALETDAKLVAYVTDRLSADPCQTIF